MRNHGHKGTAWSSVKCTIKGIVNFSSGIALSVCVYACVCSFGGWGARGVVGVMDGWTCIYSLNNFPNNAELFTYIDEQVLHIWTDLLINRCQLELYTDNPNVMCVVIGVAAAHACLRLYINVFMVKHFMSSKKPLS